MRATWLSLLSLAVSGLTVAQESDEAALAIADRTSSQPTVRRACIEYAEAAAIDTTYSDGSPSRTGGRASANIRCDGAFASGWRGVLSDRFDEFSAQWTVPGGCGSHQCQAGRGARVQPDGLFQGRCGPGSHLDRSGNPAR